MRVVVGCEYSGIVRDAFTNAGHEAVSVDLFDSESEGNHHKGDLFEYLASKPDWYFDLGIFHPPCTFLTVTGNKWMKPEFESRFPTRKQDRADAKEFFMRITRLPIRRIAIENPIGIMSTAYRKPDQIIQPYQFGHNTSKATCLWLTNLPKLSPTNIVEPEWYVYASGKRDSFWHVDSMKLPKKERSKFRSRTFTGIAEAMANQWG